MKRSDSVGVSSETGAHRMEQRRVTENRPFAAGRVELEVVLFVS